MSTNPTFSSKTLSNQTISSKTISGKTALITGASRGIGRAIAHALARQGAARIILVARNPHRLAAVAAEVEQLGAQAVSLALDVTQPVAVNVAIAQTWQQHGPIHLLVNCAGVAHQAPFCTPSCPRSRPKWPPIYWGYTPSPGWWPVAWPRARRAASSTWLA